jgi:hypothetical protein
MKYSGDVQKTSHPIFCPEVVNIVPLHLHLSLFLSPVRCVSERYNSNRNFEEVSRQFIIPQLMSLASTYLKPEVSALLNTQEAYYYGRLVYF